MKKVLFVLLLCFPVTFVSVVFGGEADVLYQEAVKALEDDGISKQHMEKSVVLLSEALQHAPDRVKILRLRASLLSNLGRMQEAKADAARVASLEPADIEARMLVCLLSEKLGDVEGDIYTCYQKVADMYKANISDPLQADDPALINYTYALKLANSPEFEKYKRISLGNITNKGAKEIFQRIFEEVDRKQLLPSQYIFGL